MDESTDPFRHHPNLRDKIVPPEESRFRTLDSTATERKMRALGFPESWRRSHENREASRQESLQDRWGQDIWVFGYGSLMWDPAFHFTEIRRASLSGYHRRFCLRSEFGRGTPDQPGLMAGLDRGGACNGLVFRIAADALDEESKYIWRREMSLFSYAPEFLSVETQQGELLALSFVVNRDNPLLLPPMSIEETARRIAHAEGVHGPNIDYLENLAHYFEVLKMEDAELFELRGLARSYRQQAG